jgi:hypothetical protein
MSFNRSGGARGRGAKIDRFGNPYRIVACKEKENRDGGAGWVTGYIELGGKMYKIQPYPGEGEVHTFVRVTAVPKRKQVQL